MCKKVVLLIQLKRTMRRAGAEDEGLDRLNKLINATRSPDLRLAMVAGMLAWLTIAAVKAIWILELSE